MYFWGRWIAIASASSWTLCCEGADHQVQLTPAQQAELEPRFTALDLRPHPKRHLGNP